MSCPPAWRWPPSWLGSSADASCKSTGRHSPFCAVPAGAGSARSRDGLHERPAQVQRAIPVSTLAHDLKLPESFSTLEVSVEDALRDVVRSRLEMLGPVRAKDVANSMSLPVGAVEHALAITLAVANGPHPEEVRQQFREFAARLGAPPELLRPTG